MVNFQKSDISKIEELQRPRPNWLQPLVLLAPSGIWLLLLLVLPTLIIFQLSLVADIRPGDLVNPNGFKNYIRIFDPLYVQVIVRSLFFAFGTTIICLSKHKLQPGWGLF